MPGDGTFHGWLNDHEIAASIEGSKVETTIPVDASIVLDRWPAWLTKQLQVTPDHPMRLRVGSGGHLYAHQSWADGTQVWVQPGRWNSLRFDLKSGAQVQTGEAAMQFGAMSELNQSIGFSGSNPQTVATLVSETAAAPVTPQRQQPTNDLAIGGAVIGAAIIGLVVAILKRRK